MNTVKRVFRPIMGIVSLLLGIGLLAGTAEAVVTVDCNAKKPDSLAVALTKAAPGEPVVIEGTCNENVTITVDDVTLQGDPLIGGEVIGADATQATIRIQGKRGVVIDSLTVRGGLTCVLALNGAFVTLRDSIIENCDRDGVAIVSSSTGIIEGSTIRNAARYGLVVSNTSSAGLRNNVIRSNVVDAPLTLTDPFRSAALGVFHASFLRLQGGNFIVNDAPGGIAVQVFHLADFRQQFSLDRIEGSLALLVGNNSVAELRGEFEVIGNISVLRHSTLSLSIRSRREGIPPVSVITADNITLFDDSTAVFGLFTPKGEPAPLGSVQVIGTLTCSDIQSSVRLQGGQERADIFGLGNEANLNCTSVTEVQPGLARLNGDYAFTIKRSCVQVGVPDEETDGFNEFLQPLGPPVGPPATNTLAARGTLRYDGMGGGNVEGHFLFISRNNASNVGVSHDDGIPGFTCDLTYTVNPDGSFTQDLGPCTGTSLPSGRGFIVTGTSRQGQIAEGSRTLLLSDTTPNEETVVLPAFNGFPKAVSKRICNASGTAVKIGE